MWCFPVSKLDPTSQAQELDKNKKGNLSIEEFKAFHLIATEDCCEPAV